MNVRMDIDPNITISDLLVHLSSYHPTSVIIHPNITNPIPSITVCMDDTQGRRLIHDLPFLNPVIV